MNWGKLDSKYEGPFAIQKNVSSINDPSIVYKQVTGAHLKPYLTAPTSPLKKMATIKPEEHCLSKQIDQVDLSGISSSKYFAESGNYHNYCFAEVCYCDICEEHWSEIMESLDVIHSLMDFGSSLDL